MDQLNGILKKKKKVAPKLKLTVSAKSGRKGKSQEKLLFPKYTIKMVCGNFLIIILLQIDVSDSIKKSKVQ